MSKDYDFNKFVINPLREIMKSRKILISIIGGGGKTTLINLLFDEFKIDKKVLYTSTTHMLEPKDISICINEPSKIRSEALFSEKVSENKYKGISCEKLESINKDNIYDLILCEADGSRAMPFKIHNQNEPQLLTNSDVVFVIVGCDAFYLPIDKAVHRLELLEKSNTYILSYDVALEYLLDLIEQKISMKSKIILVFNKFESYGLPFDFEYLIEFFSKINRNIEIFCTELEKKIVFKRHICLK